MKNYDEVTRDLLQRRDRYIAEQKSKRRRLMGFAASLCCFCLTALFGFGMWQGWWQSAGAEHTVDDALYPGIKDYFDVNKGESPDDPAANNKIIVHRINGISSDMNICLLCDDFVEMTHDEMKAYYGIDYVPEVPSDIKAWEDERCGIYKRDGGTGEVYWDADMLNYSNEDFTRTVHVQVAKGGMPLIDYFFYGSYMEKSIINNIEVMIGQTDNGLYYAEFMYCDAGFIINAQGVSLEEFVAIIASIVN